MDKCSFLSPKKKKNNVALLYVITFGAPMTRDRAAVIALRCKRH